jgi:hypothetical protein
MYLNSVNLLKWGNTLSFGSNSILKIDRVSYLFQWHLKKKLEPLA